MNDKSLVKAMEAICQQWGGPRQYLQATYQDENTRMQFAKDLAARLPMRQDVIYTSHLPLPVVDEEDKATQTPLALHLAMFAFHNDSSLKHHPEQHVVMLLTEEILKDGFLAAGDPLLIRETQCPPEWVTKASMPWHDPTAPGVLIQPFSVAYTRGSARICTLLALWSLCISEHLNVEQAVQLCTLFNDSPPPSQSVG